MGRSSSKMLETPNNPLQELQYLERKRAHQKRKLEKEQKQIAKLQKKHAKRQQKKLKKQQQQQQQQQYGERKGSSQSQCDSIVFRMQRRVSGSSGGMQQHQLQQQQQQQQRGSNSLASSQNMRYDAAMPITTTTTTGGIGTTSQHRTDVNHAFEAKLQTNLQSDLCTFIMNQMSLTQQFFANFEKEIITITEELLAKENDYNQKLEEHSILLTSPLDMAVGKWVHYKPLHGVEKHHAQPLQRPVMYVIFENIDIARPNDANYDSITPLCKVDIETEFYQTTPCKEDYMTMLRETKWKGYVRLKLKDNPKLQQQQQQQHQQRPQAVSLNGSSAAEEIYIDSSSSGYGSSGNYCNKLQANEYRYESDYDYAFIAHLNTHHPLNELRMSNQREKATLDAKVLPESCVSSLSHCMDMWQVEESDDDDLDESDSDNDDDYYDEHDDDDDNDDEDQIYSGVGKRRHSRRSGLHGIMSTGTHAIGRDYETIMALKLYKQELERRRNLMQQRYLNSKEFMRYFGELVRQKLAQPLEIPDEQLLKGSYRGCSIYTNEFEIVPAVHVAQNAHHWPDCAFQFRIRDRAITTSSQTGQQFQWPTRTMIKRIETFGFHLIPIGYTPKKTRNPFRTLEWRIVFPKAERYLERHLTNAQVKVFMMTKALLKTFVESRENNKALIFVLEHIRVHLFWECERNFTDWPEEFLGDVLLRFISSFMVRLREKCLCDFFIDERNLFESIPEYSLVTLYSIMADILANPLMHMMVTFRYLSFPERFFPKLNIRKLFDNLVENDMIKLRGLSKNARTLFELDKEVDEPLLMDEGAKGLVGMKQHREKTQGKLRRKTHIMRHNLEIKKKQDFEARRRSVESIDVEFFFANNIVHTSGGRINQGVENLRRTNILEIFLDHLLDMCERSAQWRSLHQAKIYLTQAQRLCKLYHNYGCDMGAKEYFSTINSMEEELVEMFNNNCAMNLPTLPLRPSVEPVRPFLIKEPLDNRNINVEHEEVRRHDIEQAIAHCEQRLDAVRHSDPVIWQATPELKRSIKFEEHVVEVYEGDLHPNQKSKNCSPVSILRSTTHDNQRTQDKNVISKCDESQPNSNLQTKLTNTISAATDLIKNAPLANPKVLNKLAISTEKLLNDVTAEERRAQLQEMLKKTRIQIKGIFHQSTDS